MSYLTDKNEILVFILSFGASGEEAEGCSSIPLLSEFIFYTFLK